MDDHIARPPTPQAMVHRLPDKSDESFRDSNKKPAKFLIIVLASTAVAGKLQIAKAVSAALACPLFQGDSLHESAAKAATVSAANAAAGGANEARYQRMWLSKMTRTGLLFPEESRAAGAGFSGFGGGSFSNSTSTSRRGSASSDASEFSASDATSVASSVVSSGSGGGGGSKHINKPPIAALSPTDAQRRMNPALVVLTHPKLERWQKACIRRSVGEFSIGVIFVPLDPERGEDGEDDDDDNDDDEGEDELPILRPLDPSIMTSFGSLASIRHQEQARDWTGEIAVKVDVNARVSDLAEDVVEKVRDVMDE